MRTCSVAGCLTKVKAKDLCAKHYMRMSRRGHVEATRITGTVEDLYTAGSPEECWPWRGSINSYGYGRYGNQPVHMAHRLVYEATHGPIPDGLVLDHLCRNTACVNPNHLQPVAQGVNIERGLLGYAMRTVCKKGLHDVTVPEAWYINSAGARTCLECKRANDRRAEAKRKGRRRR